MASTSWRTLCALAAVAVLALAVRPAAAHFANGQECGVNHPHVKGHIDAMPDEVVPQRYHTVESARRVLATQQYPEGAGSAFLPLSQAHEAGLTGPLRMTVMWDVVEGSDFSGSNAGDNAMQCTAVGNTIRVRCKVLTSSNCMEPWVNGCGADDVVAPGHPKLDLMKLRLNWVKDFLSASLTVKQVQDDITIGSSIVNTYQLSQSVVPNTDLVVIMTARPVPYHNLAGFAFCVQRDQHQRCTVGVFNWVPKVLDVANQALPTNIAGERHTALHEVIHILGGIFPNGPFIDDTGAARNTGVYVVERDSIGYNKPATKIVTAKALKVARDQFGCQAMTGVPIEDQPTGKGAHWEARLFGPEVMSYGSGVGEVYMSDLTFAYLEDTNQYIANYSCAGPLVVATGDTSQDTSFEVDTRDEGVVQPYSKGYLRWGRDEGCSFVDGNARDWDTRYFCSKHRAFECTYDNRMAGVCDIRRTWQLSKQYTCGTFQGGITRCDQKLNDNCDSSSGCRLPTILQHFTSATAAAAAGAGANPGQTGGYSSAMDFVPVRIGYWNCQNAKPSGNASSQLEQESDGVDLGSLTQGTEEKMRLFGGQAYCPNCRCFVSSLMEFSSGKVDPFFPRFGLCYRSNCYRKDYLQFAIQDQIGGDVTWYKCPQAGGKLYIAGFSGAFHCPVATDFCKFEEISGIKYDETEVIWEWILSSLFFTVPVLIVLMCLCCGDCMAERVKTALGVHFFENPSDNDHLGREIPPECPSRMLLAVNICTGIAGCTFLLVTMAGIASGRVSAAASTLLSFSSFVIFMSCLGGCGATRRAKGASCILLTYFYFTICCCAGYFFFACWAWIYTDQFDLFINKRWDTVVEALPADLFQKNVDYETAVGTVSDHPITTAVVGLLLLVLLAIAVTGSIMIISMPVLMASLFMVANYSFVLTGFVIVGLGAYSTVFVSGFDTNLNILVGLFVCLGLYIALNAIIGIVGAFQKSLVLLKVCLAMSLCSFLLQVGAAVVLFINSEALGDMVDELDDEDAARFTQNLGMTGLSKTEVREAIQNNVRALALASLCWIATLVVSIVTNVYFIGALRKLRRAERIARELDVHKIGASGGRHRKGRRSSPAWEGGAQSVTHGRGVV